MPTRGTAAPIQSVRAVSPRPKPISSSNVGSTAPGLDMLSQQETMCPCD